MEGTHTLSAARPSPRGFARRARQQLLLAYLLILPAALVVLGLILYPLFFIARLSIHESSLSAIRRGFETPPTLANYSALATSGEFWRSLLHTGTLVVGVSLLAGTAAMVVALLANQPLKARGALRTLFVTPWPLGGVATAVIFAWMFDSTFGVINYLLFRMGLTDGQTPWLVHPSLSWIPIILAVSWKTYPFLSVVFLAGLQSISREQYEAASIDGAGRLQAFRYVTLPGLLPVARAGLVIVFLNVFKEFETVYILTGGGPAGATQTLSIYLYREAFEYMDVGYAASIGMAMLVIGLVASYALLSLGG